MIEHHKKKANLGILIGLIANIGGQVWSRSVPDDDPMQLLIFALLIGATAVFVYGCVQYALAKGRTGWWGLFGLLSLIGLIVLVCLKDFGDPRRQPRGFDVVASGRYPQGPFGPPRR